ncbi:class I SAM-dependent methyltransferase [Bifidobacterium aquikefiricola]|uniref:Class I SAM-dependent methyltransferase n=1 Tax=Bifidobacterium aquikefiricola TaxID=3059038 RepID=A0AB39U6C0_9BIFI
MVHTDMSDADDVHQNLENWNDRASVHMHGGYGDIDSFINNTEEITSVVRRDYAVLAPFLGSQGIENRRLLHLQCHIGLDTVSWYRLGARGVCGLDFSDVALAYARSIAQRAQVPVRFVQGDARHSDQALTPVEHRFDVVVTSVGTITWLPDLTEWAQSIANLLVPGGVFMIRDDHPLLFALDNSGLNVVQDYFSGTESSYDSNSSYTEGSAGKIEHTRNHNWAHDFHEITESLIHAGLTIENIGEYEVADWQSLPMLTADENDGGWRMPDQYPRIPLTFSIVAKKNQ